MTISTKDLEKIAQLAALNIDPEHASQLNQEISSIMDFVDQLRSVDTSGTAPLFHPFALHQRQREDEVTEADCIAELEAIAPVFDDNLYLVPKVIDENK